ncbi:MAG: hypothetical protein JSS49_15590 [Planctomycetes bacterium]|nr:hypothetical protein [Planctomycetota bacterium]
MKQISNAGWYYVAFCLATCGYFCTAAVNGWSGPSFGSGGSSYSSGHTYSSGFYGGRSSGGFGGGGK